MIYFSKNNRKVEILFFLFFLFILLFSILLSQNNINYKLEFSPFGKWEGMKKNIKITMTYKTNNECIFDFTNLSINGDSFTKKITGKCDINIRKNPGTLSITNIVELNHSLFTIVEIIDNKTVKIGNFSDKWRLRPVIFRDMNSLVLNKI